ncbi:Hypothetical protein FKW44_006223, partial [Caligus rogercresseyi]
MFNRGRSLQARTNDGEMEGKYSALVSKYRGPKAWSGLKNIEVPKASLKHATTSFLHVGGTLEKKSTTSEARW